MAAVSRLRCSRLVVVEFVVSAARSEEAAACRGCISEG